MLKLKHNLVILAVALLASCTNTTSSKTENIASSNTANNFTENTNIANNSKSLIAYFSATGSTERVAQYVQEATDGTIFELVPVDPYTSADLNYNNSESRVSKEHLDTSLQDIELENVTPSDYATYDYVFIGYPIWWGNAAWPINNFIKENDFTNKTVIPFATSASSGLGNSVNLLKEMNSTGTWLDGQRFPSSASKSTVVDWVNTLNL